MACVCHALGPDAYAAAAAAFSSDMSKQASNISQSRCKKNNKNYLCLFSLSHERLLDSAVPWHDGDFVFYHSLQCTCALQARSDEVSTSIRSKRMREKSCVTTDLSLIITVTHLYT